MAGNWRAPFRKVDFLIDFPLPHLPWHYSQFKCIGAVQTFNLFLYKTHRSENSHLFFLLSFLSPFQEKYRLWVKWDPALYPALYISFFFCQGLPYSDFMWKSHHAYIHSNYTLVMKQHLLFVQLNDIFQVPSMIIFPFEWTKVAK